MTTKVKIRLQTFELHIVKVKVAKVKKVGLTFSL